MDAAPTEAERSAVDGFLGLPETGWEGGLERSARDLRVVRGGREARDQRHLLLPALHALQAGVGWISRGGLNYVSQRLSVPPADAYGVATFYAMFSVEERPANVVHVCDDLACRGAGGLALCEELERDAAPEGRRRRRLDLGPIAMPRDVRAGAGRLRAARRDGRGGARRSDPGDRRRDRRARLHRRVRRRGRGAADARARRRARVCGSSAGPASSIPRRSTTTARTAATRRSAPRSRWAPRP